MVVSVDKTWANDLVGAVYHFHSVGCLDVLRNLHNLPVFNEDAGCRRYDMILRIVYKKRAVLEEQSLWCHECSVGETILVQVGCWLACMRNECFLELFESQRSSEYASLVFKYSMSAS